MSRNKRASRRYRASVLIISMIFTLIFSALAMSMASMSGANVQIASNLHNINAALASAQSGQEVMRYWFSDLLISSSTPVSEYLPAIIASLQTNLSHAQIYNITLQNDGSISSVVLDSTEGLCFDSQIQIAPGGDPTILLCSVTGHSGTISRTITVAYSVKPYEFPIFNFGLATKGPLDFPNNPTVTAVNSAWEADMFVESSGDSTAVYVGGNTNFDGEVNIGNTLANVDFVGDVNIAGDYDQTAIDNHVHIGVDSPEFPAPDTDRFIPYATGSIIDSSTDLSANNTLVNCTIAAGTNPVFPKSVTIQGVLFIESPNKVTFSNNVDLQGLIVADGNVVNSDPSSRSITFMGNFCSGPYPTGSEFDAIRQEEGSSILAPGFFTSFGGNFSTLEGVVAVSGVQFTGNMDAQIKGTIINYSNSSTLVEGNVIMNFDREGSTKIPAGFDLYRELDYDPSTYSES
ncbi:MAG: pilus assembly PilX N-terminal domain-containing protein [Sedimentisphaerales bacterium]|nr:pilus assembly PilX N-terminal domain-containing protein [Sedimentisphaerales bacterium]